MSTNLDCYDTIEIIRDFDGTYYSSIPDLPKYVPYHKLRQAMYDALNVMPPDLDELTFRGADRKTYAYFRMVITGDIYDNRSNIAYFNIPTSRYAV